MYFLYRKEKQMLRIAICDDDKKFVKHFNSLITKELNKRKIQAEILEYYTEDVLLSHHNMNPFNLVFLDIEMHGLNGFDVAKEMSDNCFIVFVTSHNELVYDSFIFRPLGFIPKDSDEEMTKKLKKILEQLIEISKQNQTVIFENKEKGRFSLVLRDIMYVESNNHFINIHLCNTKEPITVRYTMTNFEKEYSNYHFVRIHKKYIVNLKYVFNISLSNESLKIKHGGELPMGRKYKNNVDFCFTKYLRRIK